jgi:membrane-associated phospholipid phosphatase
MPHERTAQPEPAPDRVRPARDLLAPIAAAVVLAVVLTPADPAIARAVGAIPLAGDARRTLETLQQFGDLATMAIAIILIALLDRRRLRRTLDWILAAILAALAFNATKVLTGRLRPRMVEEGSGWLGPLAEFTTEAGDIARPIEFWAPGVHEALAMPSTHTAHAAVAAVFLAAMYPPLRWLVWPWVALVALARVRLGAHWPTDTIVGAGLAIALASVVVRRYWGVRGLDWLWKRVVDRGAGPAFPATRRADLDAAERLARATYGDDSSST